MQIESPVNCESNSVGLNLAAHRFEKLHWIEQTENCVGRGARTRTRARGRH